jgi:restriction system protein
MALTDRPLYRELFWPTLKAIQDLGGSATRQEVLTEVASHFTVDEQAEVMPNGRTPRLHYYTSWNLTRLKRVGALDNSQQGVWAVTDRGRKITESDIESLWEEMRDAYRKLRQERLAEGAATGDGDEVPGGESTDGDSGSGAWKDTLIDRLKSMDPAAFERLVQRLLREADFEKVQVTGRAGDGGIDGVGLIKLGLLSFPTYFQCKRYAGTVGAGAVRDFRGAMAGRGEKGVLITTASFTPAAQQEATRDGVTPIDLVDGDELCDLLKRHRVGVHVTQRVSEDVALDMQFWEAFD